MTVQSIDPRVIYDGDAVTRVFPFGFDMAAESTLRVSFVGLGLAETVVPPEDYSVTRFGQGGEVTFDDAPPADVKVVLTRRTPFTQQVSVTAQTAYDPRVVESVWDKLTVVSQELAMAQQTMLRGAPGTDPTGIYEEIMRAADTTSESVGLAVGAKEAAERAAQDAVEVATNLSSVVRYNAQTLTAPQQAQARTNIGAADSATAAVNTRTVTAGTGLTGGGDLTADRTIAADFATEAEALAGTATDKVMSPARVADAIAANDMWAGHTWRVVTTQRSIGTAYQNTTAAAIQVLWLGGNGSLFQWSLTGTAWVSLNSASYTKTAPIIAPGQYYRFSGGTLAFVAEYRND